MDPPCHPAYHFIDFEGFIDNIKLSLKVYEVHKKIKVRPSPTKHF